MRHIYLCLAYICLAALVALAGPRTHAAESHPGLDTEYGELLPGDELLLTTDALAAWVLSRASAAEAERPLDLPAFAAFDQQDFAEWVDDQRARARMRNDDVTLVRAKVGTEA